MHRIDGAGNSAGMFVAENESLNIPPTEITPDWMNAVQEELASFMEWLGVGLAKADNTQLRQAIGKHIQQARGIMVGAATGTVDAITANYSPAIASLTNGMTLYLRASGANTYLTPSFSPNNMAFKPIVKGSNTQLVPGDIAGAGHWIVLQYDSVLDKWVLLNPATGVAAATALASNATTQAGVSTTQAVTPAGLMATMLGGNGQTPQNVTGSRAVGTNYTNSSGRPIMVMIGYSAGNLTPTVGGIALPMGTAAGGATATSYTFMVPTGMIYSVASGPTITSWLEFR